MGSGKTAAGRVLAELLALPFVDLDERICSAAGATVTELFERHGEVGFRAREAAALTEVSSESPAVVACGGGAFCSAANREVIPGAGHLLVFLDVPWEVIVRRLEGHQEDRPLFDDVGSASRLFLERRPAYRLARVQMTLTGDESPELVARRIETEMLEVGCAT